MKITRLSVTDIHGNEHTWIGETGYVSIMALAARPPAAPSGAMANVYAHQVQANLTLPLPKGVEPLVEDETDPGLSV